MKKEKQKVGIIILIILIISAIVLYLFLNKEVDKKDENELLVQKFDNYYLRFERYDYVLGQNMLVAVEKSIDGKNYTKVTDELLQVSNESKFKFLSDKIFFVISTKYLSKNRDYKGLKVSVDGGKSFTDAKFNYENNRIENIEITEFPVISSDNTLKLNINLYDLAEDGNGYKDYKLIFKSLDNGLTWTMEKLVLL